MNEPMNVTIYEDISPSITIMRYFNNNPYSQVKMSNCNAAFLINNENIWSDGCGPKLTAKILDKKDILGMIGLAIIAVQVSLTG